MFHKETFKLCCSCTIECIFQHIDDFIIKNKNNYHGISSGQMFQFRVSQDNFALFINLACHSSTSACFFIILFCSFWNPYLDLVGKMRICLCFPEPKPTSRNMVWQCGSKYYNCQARLQLQLQLS